MNRSAREIHREFASGDRTAAETLEACLNCVTQRDPQVGAFLRQLDDRAREQAEKLDAKRAAGKPLGKLAGVPIAIKDNIHIRGEITTCGSKFLTNFRSPFSATVVELLENEDALLIGKTNLDEFAMGSSTENSALGVTRNPWNLKCVPGGSSGGSAAAVSARMVPLALGSDTGGSVRQPAAFCGVVGFKPSYGRVSRYGLVAFGSSLDQIGPFATRVSDVGMIMEVLGRHCPHDSTSLSLPPEDYEAPLENLQGVKIGVPWHFLEGLAKPVQENFTRGLDLLKSQGAEVVEVQLHALKYAIAAYYILATAEASTNLARFDGVRYGRRSERARNLDEVYDLSKEEGYGPEVKRRILLGTFVLSSGYQEAYYQKAQKARAVIIEEYQRAFTGCDLVAMPTTPTSAFEVGAVHDPLQLYLADIYTVSANLAGLPAISIPSGFDADGRPLGLQLIGPSRADVRVCQVAEVYEHAAGFWKEQPEIAQ